MKKTISVTAEDIRQGVPRATCGCPVALALKRQIPAANKRVSVGLATAILRGQDSRGQLYGEVELPSTATKWIHKFDSYGPVEPFEFEVEIGDAFH